MKIVWVGCGAMGISMLLNLKEGGHAVSAYNHTYEEAAPLFEQGIRVECTIRDRVSDADVVCTVVGYPKDVEEIYEGDDGISAHTKVHAVLIDFTTSSPAPAKKLHTAAKAEGYAMLNALVSSDDNGAKAASPSIMTGGDGEVFEQMRSLFPLLGTGIQYMGEAGSGRHTRACNRIAVAGVVVAMSGALVYAGAVGLGEQKILTAIAKGVIGS